jgi:hypothetical protein
MMNDEYNHNHTNENNPSSSTSSSSFLTLLEKPIISIMIPTTILSIFLLLTMTIFLCIHITFQAFLYLSTYFSDSRRPRTRDRTRDRTRGRSRSRSSRFLRSRPWSRNGTGSHTNIATMNSTSNDNGNENNNNDNDNDDDNQNNEYENDHDLNHDHGHIHDIGGVSLSSSPFVLWGILSILILETVLPWICLSVGIYLSFSVGGFAWVLFITSMYLLWMGLIYLRNRIYIGFQR